MAFPFRIVLSLLFVNFVCTTSSVCLSSVTIYIDAANGNNTSCLPPQGSAHPCQTLDLAFSYRTDCVAYDILSPSVNLTSAEPFSNLHNLTFSGSNTEVICSGDDVGLAFFNVSDLTFEGITFSNCGATRNSTSKNFEKEGFSLLEFRAALYLENCENVVMSSLNVSKSQIATGVVMYNTRGVNVVENSTFSDNVVPDGYPGGGGFYLEFSYCIPGDSGCVNGMEYIKVNHASYSFENSHFLNNFASSNKSISHDVYIIPFESNHHAFGRGGGLSVFMKGSSAYNVISVTNCTFFNNVAEWGGGSFVEFHDSAGSNEIVFTNCTFRNNSCKYELTQGTGGGGLRIGHYVYGINGTSSHGNQVEVLESHFLHNYAMYGGGISISPTLQDNSIGNEGFVKVTNCTFRKNTAMMGAALNINKFVLISEGIMLKMILKDLIVDSNRAFYANLINKNNTPHTEGVGALYIHHVYTTFQGHNIFDSNTHSGIAIVGTTVDFTNSTSIFRNNQGYRGGGISLLGSAYLLISENTRMTFDSNEVRNEGGAIYNRYVEMDNIKTRSNCFVRHSNPFKLPNEWGATFVFKNNMDHKHQRSNSIHSSSILPCSWAGGSGIITDLDIIFCWNNWTYLDEFSQVLDCKSQISSDAGNITFNNSPTENNDEVHVNATPGWDFRLPLTIKDDYDEDINNTIVFLLMKNEANYSTSYIWGNMANLKGTEDSNINVSLESLGDRIWEVNVIVDLQSCPLGFALGEDHTCKCAGKYGGLLLCDSGAKTFGFSDNDLWLGRINGINGSYIGPCPPKFCHSSQIIHADTLAENETLFCSHNRTGTLCGQCIDDNGPAVNSRNYECTLCTGHSFASSLSRYIASIYVPLTLLFLILIIFDIRLTTGPANAFILYCQAVSSTFGLGDGQVPLNKSIARVEFLDRLYQFVYGISNLEFMENLAHPWCLSPSFNTLTVLTLDYGVAIFPLLMILIALLIQKLKECPCRCSFKVCRDLSKVVRTLFRWRKSTVGEALLPAFAAFILLSYNKFSLTSSYILAVQPLVKETGDPLSPSRIYFAGQYTTDNPIYQRYYFIPSLIAFSFTCIVPMMLLVYPLKILEWCLRKVSLLWRFYPVDKIHFFLDTFQGCYKAKMRFFAGLYFLFRLTINSAFLGANGWLEEFIIQLIACIVMVALLAFCRPYTKEYNFLNYVDSLIFTNLLLINLIGLYLYVAIINGQHPSSLAPVIQYILVFLPFVYMICYIIYYVLQQRQCSKSYMNSLRREKRMMLPSRATISQIFTTEPPPSEDEDYEDDLLQRAENTNQYRKIADDPAINRNLEQNSIHENMEQDSSRPSESLNRMSNVTQSNGSSQRGTSLGYDTFGTTSSSNVFNN